MVLLLNSDGYYATPIMEGSEDVRWEDVENMLRNWWNSKKKAFLDIFEPIDPDESEDEFDKE